MHFEHRPRPIRTKGGFIAMLKGSTLHFKTSRDVPWCDEVENDTFYRGLSGTAITSPHDYSYVGCSNCWKGILNES